MSYKAKITELVGYFYPVHKLTQYFLEEAYKSPALRTPELYAGTSYMTDLAYGFPQITVPFRPKEPMYVLGIATRDFTIPLPASGAKNPFQFQPVNITTAYYLIYHELKPGRQYAYAYNNPTRTLEIWRDKGYKWDMENPLISYRLGALDWIPDVINFALNYKLMRSLMRPGHLEYLERLWKAYFGDVASEI